MNHANTELGGITHGFHDFKNVFSSQLSELSNSLIKLLTVFKSFLVNPKGKLKPTFIALSQKV